MIALDCESRDSTLESLSTIYKIPKESISQFLKGIDLDKHFEIADPPHPGDIELTLLFEKEFECLPEPINRVFWFHLTRAAHGTDFSEGIRPLDRAIEKIWETLFSVFTGTSHEVNLKRMKSDGVDNFHYKLKVGEPIHGGPYAMLVKESAFKAGEMGNHDYLWLPEIMEDICNGYHKTFGEQIHSELCSALAPYIVKFWSEKRVGRGCIESALYYLYRTLHNQRLAVYGNTCFDGGNSTVSREQIISVEVVK